MTSHYEINTEKLGDFDCRCGGTMKTTKKRENVLVKGPEYDLQKEIVYGWTADQSVRRTCSKCGLSSTKAVECPGTREKVILDSIDVIPYQDYVK